MTAMINPRREFGVGEIIGNGKSESLDEPKYAVAVVVSIDRGEIVGSGLECESLSCRFGRRRDIRLDNVGNPNVSAAQRLNTLDRCIDAVERDQTSKPVKRGISGICRWPSERGRICEKHKAGHVVDERPQQ